MRSCCGVNALSGQGDLFNIRQDVLKLWVIDVCNLPKMTLLNVNGGLPAAGCGLYRSDDTAVGKVM